MYIKMQVTTKTTLIIRDTLPVNSGETNLNWAKQTIEKMGGKNPKKTDHRLQYFKLV